MVIGLRSFPDGFSYVILEGTQTNLQVIDFNRLVFPKGRQHYENLSWLRRQLSEVINPYEIHGACIKTIEPVAKKKSIPRLQAEAIIQEFFFTQENISCNVRIKSQLKRDIVDFTESARYLERVLSRDERLADLNTPQFQEATLAAISELPA